MTLATRDLRLHLRSVIGAPLGGAKVTLQLSAYQADGIEIVPLVWTLTEDPLVPGDYIGPIWANTRTEDGTHYDLLVQANGQKLLTHLVTVAEGATEAILNLKINPPPYPPVYAAQEATQTANGFADAAGTSATIAAQYAAGLGDVSEAVTAAQLAAQQAADAEAQRLAYEDRVYPGVYSTPPSNKPHSGLPSADGDRCVILVSGTPYEHVRLGGGWVIPNIDAIELAMAGGAKKVGFGGRTVEDRLLERVSVLDKIPAVVNIKTANCMPYFQAAIDDLAARGGGVLEVPAVPEYYNFIASSPTPLAPARVEIRTSNITVQGVGNPLIMMTGITTAQLAAIQDPSSSARDLFAAFSFIAIAKGNIDGIRFEGEFTGNETFVFYPGFSQARAKAVSYLGCINCTASNLSGVNLLGNLVTVVHTNILYDAPYRESKSVRVKDCYAVHCLENAYNFLAGTSKCSIDGSYATTCGGNGFESAAKGTTVTGCQFVANRGGAMGLSGTDEVVTGCLLADSIRYLDDLITPIEDFGAGITITGGTDKLITGCTISGNRYAGVHIYPGVKRVTLVGNTYRNNATNATMSKAAILCSGIAGNEAEEIIVDGGKFECDGFAYAVYGAYTKNLTIKNARGRMISAPSSVVITSTCTGSRVTNNDFNKTVSSSDPTAVVFNNGDRYRFSEAAAVPAVGSFNYGDVVLNRSPVGGGPDRWRCIQSGTFGTLNAGATTGSINSGENLLTVNSATGLYDGAWITIAGVTGAKQVRSIAGLVATLDSNADASVVAAAIAYRVAVMRAEGIVDNTGSKAYDPPSLASGASTTTTLALTGAALGDFVIPSFSLDLQGLEMSAYVSTANVATVVFSNRTGGTLDIGSGTLRAKLIKVA